MAFELYRDVILTRDIPNAACAQGMSARSSSVTSYRAWPT
jgi:hypothetical protein